MNICLVKASLDNAETIHKMQVKSFMPLLEKYEDYETNPANEQIERIITRLNQSFTDYYLVQYQNINVGCIRIVKMKDCRFRVSPIFILPEYQGKGIAQKVFLEIEQIYSDAKVWELDTILQERGNCYLYEKIGYKKTGKVENIKDNMTLVFYEKYI